MLSGIPNVKIDGVNDGDFGVQYRALSEPKTLKIHLVELVNGCYAT